MQRVVARSTATAGLVMSFVVKTVWTHATINLVVMRTTRVHRVAVTNLDFVD